MKNLTIKDRQTINPFIDWLIDNAKITDDLHLYDAMDGYLAWLQKGREEVVKNNGVLANVSGSAVNNSLTKETTTDTTIWRGGWVTDNFETYYLDENRVKHYR